MPRTTRSLSTRTAQDATITISEELDSSGKHSTFSLSIAGPKDSEYVERRISREELVHFAASIDFMLAAEYTPFVGIIYVEGQSFEEWAMEQRKRKPLDLD